MNTIKDRLFALLDSVLDTSNFNQAFKPMISNLAKSFLDKASEDDLKKGITELQNVMIPWVLNGDATDENKNLE